MPIKVYNGSTWVTATPKVYNGSSWVTLASGKVYNGTSWSTWFSETTANISLADFSVNATIGGASAIFDIDGTVYGDNESGLYTIYDWIDDPSAVGSYEIRATRTSGNGPTTNLNTWLSLSSSRSWTSGSGLSFKYNDLFIEIRLASTQVVQASCNITLTNSGDDGGATVTL